MESTAETTLERAAHGGMVNKNVICCGLGQNISKTR